MNQKLTVQSVAIGALVPDPQNARAHSERNLKAIMDSLTQFGQRRPLVVTGDNIVIAGNGTLEAAKRLGWDTVTITRTPADWDYHRARAYALADNRTAELAEWDSAVLADQLLDLDANGWAIDGLGFEASDLGVFDVSEAAPPTLDDGDKKPFQQITFTLHETQAEVVMQAIAAIKLHEDTSSTVNANGNANALAALCQRYLDGQL
jgi:hypothetical protein